MLLFFFKEGKVMDNKHFSNRFDDYDESIDIVSDSSRLPKKNSKVSKPQQNPQKSSRPQNIKPVQRTNSSNKPRNNQNQQLSSKPNRSGSNQYQQKAKKKKPNKPSVIFAKVFFSIVLVCLLIFAIGFAYMSNLFGDIKFNDKVNKENAYIDDSELIGDSGVRNILLIGGDAREGDSAYRSDTMMLVSIDTNNKKIKLTSFLRDSWVYIPGKSYNKLNAACTYGGTQLVIDTIEYNFKIKIDNYAMVDFASFEGIVDALGGVNVAVTEKESAYIKRAYGSEGITVPAGDNVHLNGKQALKYCRIRKLDSDFFRTERQRKVMSAIKEKAAQASLPTVLKVVDKISQFIETDIPKNEMMKLSMKAASTYLKYDIVQMNIPADGTWKSASKNGQSVLVFDIKETTNSLHTFIYE